MENKETEKPLYYGRVTLKKISQDVVNFSNRNDFKDPTNLSDLDCDEVAKILPIKKNYEEH